MPISGVLLVVRRGTLPPSLDDHPVGCTLTGTDGLMARLAQAGLNYGFGLAPLLRGKLFFEGDLLYSGI